MSDSRELRANHAKKILLLRGVKDFGVLLDIGCGKGIISNSFAKDGAFIIGIDPNSELIKEAMKFEFCKFIIQDGTKLAFDNNKFDIIIINDVLEHVPYEKAGKLLLEARRVMKSDGLIYVSIMNRWQIQEPHSRIPLLTWLPRSTWNTLYSILMRTRRKYRDNYFPYTKKQFLELAKEVKIDAIDYTNIYAEEKIYHPDQIGSRTIRLIARILIKLGLQNQVSKIAEKFSVLLFICKN